MTDYPAWPAFALPAPPLNDSYKITLANNNRRTDMEQGLPVQRNIFRSAPTAYAVTWPMTPKQFALFMGIRKHLLADANGWFRLDVFDGEDYVERVVRFVSQPTEPTRDGGEFITSAVIETLDDIVLSADDTQALMLTYGSGMDIQGLSDRMHYAVHTAYPASVGP